MSVVITTQVQCDRCSDHASAAAVTARKPNVREARALAKADGWKLGKQKDFCRKCKAEIAEAVKAAQAGNIAK